MSEYIRSAEQICSPIQLVTGLGLEPTKVGDHYTIPCPACLNRLFILDTGFLCEETGCSFRAGGVFDLLKVSEKLDSYEKTLSRMTSMLPQLFADQDFLQDSFAKHEIVRVLEARRGLYELLLELARMQVDHHQTAALINQLRASANVDTIPSPYCFFPVPDGHKERLARIMRKYGGVGWPDTSNYSLILMPYFVNHHTVGVMLYKNGVNDRHHKHQKLESRQFQFLGLMQADPRVTDYSLVPTYAQVLKKNAEFSQTDPSKVALHLMRDSGSDLDPSWMPSKVTYLQSGQTEWNPLFMLASHTEVEIANSSHFADKPIPLLDKILFHIEERILSEGITKEVELLIQQAQLFPGAVERLKEQLSASHNLEALGDLDRFLQTKVLEITKNDGKLILRDDSYMLVQEDGSENHLSNFALKFHKNIRFYNSKDVYHSVDLLFGGRTIPMNIITQDLHNPRKLVEAVQHFPSEDMTLDEVTGLPVLSETSGRPITTLMRYLKKIPGTIPVVEGIATLGWSPGRELFHGPNFRIAERGQVDFGDIHFHPGSFLLSHFTNDVPHEVRAIHSSLPRVAKDYISIFVALIHRSFHGIQHIAVPVCRDLGGERLISEICGAVGQTKPIRFNESQWSRGGIPTNYPVFGTGSTYQQTQKLKSPIFMLTERGAVVEKVFSEEVYDAIGQTMREVFYSYLEWVMQGYNIEFSYQRSVDPNCVLAKEGQDIIRRAMGIEWEITTPAYSVLDTLFDSIPFERTQDYLAVDLNKQQVELNLSGLPAIDKTDLQLELSQFATGVVLTEHGVAAKDIDMKYLAETYYQDTPKFEEVFEIPDI